MTWEELSSVWTPLSVVVAALSGALLGYVVLGQFAADPAYASGIASPLQVGVLTVVLLAAIGLIFYGGQIGTSWIGGDTNWARVVSRFGVWLAYSAAIGLGLYLRLRRHLRARHAQAHDRAVADLAVTR
jgi:hypothetical protein